jgi:hypothetical protein
MRREGQHFLRAEARWGAESVETTICDEIRSSGRAVIIDHVAEDPAFCNHHTPAICGFQSYSWSLAGLLVSLWGCPPGRPPFVPAAVVPVAVCAYKVDPSIMDDDATIRAVSAA